MLDTRTTTTGRKNPNTPREYDNERKRKVVRLEKKTKITR